ncbi:MAG: type II secretion system protein [Sedimentisphaerales bacterium]|nr:type II secretion system protein [Sedimentisphaerales bacterium]
MNRQRVRSGFTMIELMVVILCVGVLVSVTVPIIRGRMEQAKWSEGAGMAGAIKTAVRAYFVSEPGAATALAGSLVSDVEAVLGFRAGDLTGRYFTSAQFTITSVDARGNAVITVSNPPGLTGSAVLGVSGWVYTP